LWLRIQRLTLTFKFRIEVAGFWVSPVLALARFSMQAALAAADTPP
jgi:hypothetical protein